MVPSPSLKRSSSVAGFDDEQGPGFSGNGARAVTSCDDSATCGSTAAIQSPPSLRSSLTPVSTHCDILYTQSTSSPTFEYFDDHVSQPTAPSSCSSTSIQPDHTLREVCFGMLDDILAAPLRKPVSKETLSDRTGFENSWAVAFRSETAILIDPDLAEVGQLDIHHSSILFKLKKRVPSLRCEVFLISSETSKSDRQSLRKAFEAVVNLYGSYTDKDQIGTHLEDEKAYLQEPVYLEQGVFYSNPHVFTATSDDMTPVFGNQHDEKRKIFASAITSIMHQSTTFHDNSSFHQDKRIKSKLNAHQVIAVKFAMSRENASLSANMRTLWHEFQSSLGTQFRHSLTKVLNSHPQNECRGGLLADEMGMGKSLSMLSLIVHTLHEAHEFAQQPRLSDSQQIQTPLCATLIITPKSTIDSWMKEIQRHLSQDTVSVAVYHGPDKNKQLARLEQASIVLTTYETATKSCLSSDNVLCQFFWFRVILDEAHHIRNTSTQTFSAVCSLAAQRRWCLTGTPIQNGLNDMFALTRFLRFEPFVSPKDIRSYITGPLSRHDELGLTNLRAMMMVCSIRRVKSDLDLPAVHSHVVPVMLSDSEHAQYDQVKNDLMLELSEAIKRGKVDTSITTLAGIRKLRQICCQGLATSMVASRISKTRISKRSICTECGIKFTNDSSSVAAQSACDHTLCNACLTANAQASEGALDGLWVCPACEQFGDALLGDDRDIKIDLTDQNNKEEVDALAASRSTSKMQAVLSALNELHGDQANISQPPTKSLVFTYWIRALDTIESGLKLQHIPYVRIDGQTPLQQRHDAISRFQTDPSCLVALLTLGTGSVGLNLTAASHVHLVEPHWNPMVEEQAAARAHRIGQTKEVTVHRYIVQNSIEERIRNKQHQKFHLAHLAGVGEDYVKRYNIGQKDVDELDSVFEKCQLL